MTDTWGRPENAGTWPHPIPAWTLTTAVVAILSAGTVGTYRCRATWTPLQRWYLPAFVRSRLLSDLGLTTGGYRLIEAVDHATTRLALDRDVRPLTTSRVAAMTPARLAEVVPPFALSPAAAGAGLRQLQYHNATYPHAALHTFLRHWIYQDQTLTDLARPALWTGLTAGTLGLLVAIPLDRARARARRHGRRLRGPELVPTARMTPRLEGDGVGFPHRRLLREPRWIRIPRALESSHLLILGDSGTGKSTLIRHLLAQLDARGETAIVYDPAMDYTPRFYTPARGDLILNPLDARSPYWSPGDEWRHEAETLTLARSLFPDRPGDVPFFTDAARKVFAHLLLSRPTPHDLAGWLAHEEALDRRLAGTAFASTINPQAPSQRFGVLATLNLAADALKVLPAERDTTARWSAAAWATTRRGWLFLTCPTETRERLVPLFSLWLDTLVLRLMNPREPHPQRTWFVFDELQTLQRLPQLHTAVTENRKANVPVILSFQGRAQLETRYGHDAEALLSQPATKIFLRTSEPRAAEWIAKTIGDIEIERLRESRSSGRHGHQTYGLERQVEPLVMPSELQGLPALRAYLKVGNLVARLTLPLSDRPKQAPDWLPRTDRSPARRPLADVAPDASAVPGRAPQLVLPDPARARERDQRRAQAHEFLLE